MKYKIIIIAFILLSFIGLLFFFFNEESVFIVKNKEKDYYKNKKLNIEIKKSITVSLDIETPQELNGLYAINKGKYIGGLIFLNSIVNSLQIYNKHGDLVHKIKLPKEGPKGVGVIEGFLFINEDSLFILNRSDVLFFLDKDLNIRKKYNLRPNYSMAKYAPSPRIVISGDMQMAIINSKEHILINGVTMGEPRDESKNNRPNIIDLDLNISKFNYRWHYPENYRHGTWDNLSIRSFHKAYNEEKKEFIFSYPIEHNIHISNDLINDKELYGGSIYINEIKSLSKIRMPPPFRFSRSKRKDLFFLNSLYSSIYYDPYRKLIYRFCHHSLNESIYNLKGPYAKKISLIVLNSKYDYIGESMIGDYVDPETCFVNEEGLHIKKYNNNENLAEFVCLKVNIARQ